MRSDLAIFSARIRKSFPLQPGSLARIWLGRSEDGPRYEALKGVNLAVPFGEFLGILGVNGAGKSTLLRVLAGIYSPDAGFVAVNGDLAALFELGGLGNTQLTGREFATRFLQLYGVPTRELPVYVAEIEAFSELEEYFDEKILTYSAGMGARLYFSVATSAQHSIYLIDEILSVGDEHFQVKSRVRMRNRLSRGASGILVTHDWVSIMRLCRQASILDQGRLTPPAAAGAAIATYLDQPAPDTSVARLVAKQAHHAVSGSPLALELDVEILHEAPVDLAVSLESMHPGAGWELVVLSEFERVGNKRGRYRVRFEMPYTPLCPGRYELCLFLSSLDEETGQNKPLDTRSWTYGNALELVVEGPEREDVAPFPVVWSQVAP